MAVYGIQGKDGQVTKEEFRTFRCGLSFPNPPFPGYFAFVGQSTKSGVTGRYPLRLVAECKAEMPSELFKALLDQMAMFRCREVFADVSDKANVTTLEELCTARLRDIKIQQPPFLENASHGILLVREWLRDGDLQIPRGSIVHDQLQLANDDLREGAQFFALTALRFIIAGYDNVLSYWLPSPPPQKVSRAIGRIDMKGVL